MTRWVTGRPLGTCQLCGLPVNRTADGGAGHQVSLAELRQRTLELHLSFKHQPLLGQRWPGPGPLAGRERWKPANQ